MRADLLPVDVQIREDAALGAAWRRCETALPEGHIGPEVGPASVQLRRWTARSHGHIPGSLTMVFGDTPTDALNALADALEARRAAERWHWHSLSIAGWRARRA